MRHGKGYESYYETFQEFVDALERGEEIEFRYNGKGFWITHPTEAFDIYQYGGSDNQCLEETARTYETAEEMLESYDIDGKKLKDIALEIEIF